MQKLFVLTLCLSVLSGCLDPGAEGNLVPKTVDEDPALPRETWNGSTFHLETFGDEGAPVIVMLHGGPGLDHRGMLRLRNAVNGRRLEDTHRLVFWDQRGSGLSQRHDQDAITIDAYEADLDQLIDRHSPDQPVVLIGHSWGGMYASMYMARHPEKVAGAVLLEPGPLTGARYSAIESEIQNLDLFSEWLNDYTWAANVVSPYDHARADYLLLLGSTGNAQPTYHESEHDKQPVWRLGAVAATAIAKDGMRDGKPAWDFTQGLERFDTKVLIQASGLNTTIGEEFQRMQVRDFVNAELAVIEGAGHDFPWTHAEQTLAPIFDYLDAIGF